MEHQNDLPCTRKVAPFAGAWIEIAEGMEQTGQRFVAPFAGAWIEIIASAQLSVLSLSLPSRERGLKWQFHAAIFSKVPVAPFAGAWIEI